MHAEHAYFGHDEPACALARRPDLAVPDRTTSKESARAQDHQLGLHHARRRRRAAAPVTVAGPSQRRSRRADPDRPAALVRRADPGQAHLRGLRAGVADALGRSLFGSDQHDAQVRRLEDAARPGVGQHPRRQWRRRRQPASSQGGRRQDIVQYGFGAVSRLLLEHDLLDELRLWVHPFILGSGDPDDLLFGAARATSFHLADATPLSDGTVILSYRTDLALQTAPRRSDVGTAHGVRQVHPQARVPAGVLAPRG
jgi:hypothetical protein